MQLELELEPSQTAGEIAPFPLARSAFVARIVSDMRGLRHDERGGHWHGVCRRLLRSRLADGLTHEQAVTDLVGLRDAVHAGLAALPPAREAQVLDLDAARCERLTDAASDRKEIA